MVRRGNGRRTQGALTLRVHPPAKSTTAETPSSSATTTQNTTANPTTQTSEADKTEEVVNDIAALTLDTPLIPFIRKRRVPSKPFPLLQLPSEIRIRIYEYFFEDDDPEDVLDLGPDNYKRYHRKLGLMRVNRLIHEEATHVFYSNRTFRIFPIAPGKYFKSKKPLPARLKKCQRECVTSLQLRLGPGWGSPPQRGWVVNDALGLGDFIKVKKLQVFVQCDPSDAALKGFRRSEGFYENFSRQLMAQIVNAMPSVTAIEFDGWTSVKKKGVMMQGLIEEAKKLERDILWGPLHGWTDVDCQDDEVVVNEKNPFMSGPLVMHDVGHYNVQVSA